jgi:hypothetical protein
VTSRWMARMRISRTGRTVPSPPVRARLHGACGLRHTANSPLTGVEVRPGSWPKRRRRLTRAQERFLDENRELVSLSHGQHWTPAAGQSATPVYSACIE